MTTPRSMTIPLLGGALADVPTDARGYKLVTGKENSKEWAAIVEADGRVPGGLRRDFLSTARGDGLYYLARNIEVGNVLEFASDRIFGDDRKRNRIYARVLTKTAVDLTLELHDTSVAAFLAARAAEVPCTA